MSDHRPETMTGDDLRAIKAATGSIKAQIRAVACPACDAEKGQPCQSLAFPQVLGHFHARRESLARELRRLAATLGD